MAGMGATEQGSAVFGVANEVRISVESSEARLS